MIEQLVYSALLAGHNIAMVLISGGLFYLMKTWQYRLKIGGSVEQLWDRALEVQTLWILKVSLRMMGALALTGFGFPIIHYLFNGQTKNMSTIASAAFAFKMILIILLMGLLILWAIKILKPIKAILNKALSGDQEQVKVYDELRQKRLGIIKLGFILCVLILMITPVMHYF